MERVERILKKAQTYYLATVEGNQPRVRSFGNMKYAAVTSTHLHKVPKL